MKNKVSLNEENERRRVRRAIFDKLIEMYEYKEFTTNEILTEMLKIDKDIKYMNVYSFLREDWKEKSLINIEGRSETTWKINDMI